jgi:ribonuclease J
MLQALQPKHIIPAHQSLQGLAPYVDLTASEGYTLGRDVHVSRNGNIIQLAD